MMYVTEAKGARRPRNKVQQKAERSKSTARAQTTAGFAGRGRRKPESLETIGVNLWTAFLSQLAAFSSFKKYKNTKDLCFSIDFFVSLSFSFTIF